MSHKFAGPNKCKKCDILCDGSICTRCRYYEYAVTSQIIIDPKKCIKCLVELKEQERHICNKCVIVIERYIDYSSPRHQFIEDDGGMNISDVILLNAIIHNHNHTDNDCDCDCDCNGCD